MGAHQRADGIFNGSLAVFSRLRLSSSRIKDHMIELPSLVALSQSRRLQRPALACGRQLRLGVSGCRGGIRAGVLFHGLVQRSAILNHSHVTTYLSNKTDVTV